MPNVNWQAYLDGSMEAADRAAADRLLRESEDARRELDGLKKFIAEIRRQAIAEEVPLARLHGMIPRAEPKRRSFVPVFALAAACIVLVSFFAIRPGRDSNEEIVASDF